MGNVKHCNTPLLWAILKTGLTFRGGITMRSIRTIALHPNARENYEKRSHHEQLEVEEALETLVRAGIIKAEHRSGDGKTGDLFPEDKTFKLLPDGPCLVPDPRVGELEQPSFIRRIPMPTD